MVAKYETDKEVKVIEMHASASETLLGILALKHPNCCEQQKVKKAHLKTVIRVYNYAGHDLKDKAGVFV